MECNEPGSRINGHCGSGTGAAAGRRKAEDLPTVSRTEATGVGLRHDNPSHKNTMKQKAQKPTKDVGRDSKEFEKLPAKTKELLILSDREEKAIGPEKVAVQKITRSKSNP